MMSHYNGSLVSLFQGSGVFDSCRHVTIDVQQDYIEDSMEPIVDHIENVIAPSFNKLGIPTFWIYWPKSQHCARTLPELKAENFQGGGPALYKVVPSDIDKVIPKTNTSAFTPGLLERHDSPTLTELVLYEDRVDVLLVDGFCYEQCVMQTVLDARKRGYGVVILEDGTNKPDSAHYKDAWRCERLSAAGVIFSNTKDVVAALKKNALDYPAISL